MQYLLINESDTLMSVSNIVGSKNVDAVLAENSIPRTPNVGKQWKDKCDKLLETNPPEVTGSRKAALLNSLTGSEELFEKACLMDEDEWKIFSSFQSFKDTLRIPESVKLPYSQSVIGNATGSEVVIGSGVGQSGSSSGRTRKGSNTSETSKGSYSGSNNISSVIGTTSTSLRSQSSPVDPNTYRAVMKNLKQSSSINPEVFNSVNSSPATGVERSVTSQSSSIPLAFDLPWGQIQLYSSLLQEAIDVPAYPEEFSTARTATYSSMPDTIYQYEPWIVYDSSGPREQSLSFHLHRDMWSGNHLDGKANELIRFCEANTFPRYSGSTVLAPVFTVYINGSTFVSGALLNTQVNWRGPLGQDNWPLEFDLSLSIQEVAETALNIDSVRKFGLIGG